MPVYGSNSIISFDSGSGESAPSTEDIVKQKLTFFLSTNKGEVPNNPDYGANLIMFTHLPLNQGLVDSIDAVIKAELGMWFPYVTVEGIDKIVDKDNGKMAFTLYYTLNEKIQTLDFYV